MIELVSKGEKGREFKRGSFTGKAMETELGEGAVRYRQNRRAKGRDHWSDFKQPGNWGQLVLPYEGLLKRCRLLTSELWGGHFQGNTRRQIPGLLWGMKELIMVM